MYYRIKETLDPCTAEDLQDRTMLYAAVVTAEEFEKQAAVFDMGIDLDLDFRHLRGTKLQVNSDSLTGCFSIPAADGKTHRFAVAVDERGIVFINDDGTAEKVIGRIRESRRWKRPCLERFIYDFLEGLVQDDLDTLEGLEKEMDAMEDRILEGSSEGIMSRLADIRSELLDFRTWYEQLLDVGQELEENENNFFKSENLRFFRLFTKRCERLQYNVSSLRDHTLEIRDLYQTAVNEKESRNMTFLTVIATIFTPLTLITGWYGMNFVYMPELTSRWGYPGVIVLSLLISAAGIAFFKHNKWI